MGGGGHGYCKEWGPACAVIGCPSLTSPNLIVCWHHSFCVYHEWEGDWEGESLPLQCLPFIFSPQIGLVVYLGYFMKLSGILVWQEKNKRVWRLCISVWVIINQKWQWSTNWIPHILWILVLFCFCLSLTTWYTVGKHEIATHSFFSKILDSLEFIAFYNNTFMKLSNGKQWWLLNKVASKSWEADRSRACDIQDADRETTVAIL